MSKCYVSSLINTALAEVGYLEKNTNASLDSKTANAGYNNFTKYAKELDNIKGFYNGLKNGYSWCAVFVDWCFLKAYGKTDMIKLTHHTKYGASCTQSAKQYQSKKQWYKTPQVGDEIFFGSEIDCSHTGIVYKVDDAYVYTVEGNTSASSGVVANGGGVFTKKYLKTNRSIAGYGRPKYDVKVLKSYSGRLPTLPSKGYLSIGDKSTEVKYLQKFLNWYFGNKKLTVDGQYGNLTKNAVEDFQKSVGITVDGIFGKNSLSKAKAVKV